METKVAAFTIKVWPGLVMAPSLAVILVVPAATAVAKPLALMVAVAGVPLVQVTEPVIFAVELSEYVPVAVNCWVALTPIVGLIGVTAIETRVTAFTVKVWAGLVMAPKFAVILVVPADTPVAKPVLLIVARAGVPLVQVTELVILAVELSE